MKLIEDASSENEVNELKRIEAEKIANSSLTRESVRNIEEKTEETIPRKKDESLYNKRFFCPPFSLSSFFCEKICLTLG